MTYCPRQAGKYPQEVQGKDNVRERRVLLSHGKTMATRIPERPLENNKQGRTERMSATVTQHLREESRLMSAGHSPVRSTGKRTTRNDAFIVNVGGEEFAIKQLMLDQNPNCLLTQLTKDDPAYDPQKNEYFFDRNARFMPYILDYLEGNEFHYPQCFCPQALLEELVYWRLSQDILPGCCARNVAEHQDQQVN